MLSPRPGCTDQQAFLCSLTQRHRTFPFREMSWARRGGGSSPAASHSPVWGTGHRAPHVPSSCLAPPSAVYASARSGICLPTSRGHSLVLSRILAQGLLAINITFVERINESRSTYWTEAMNPWPEVHWSDFCLQGDRWVF